MKKVRVRICAEFRIAGGPHIDDHAFAALDELYELTGISDLDLDVDLSQELARFELTAEGPSENEAFLVGISALRTAIHAAGGRTDRWEQAFGLPQPTDAPVWETVQHRQEMISH